MEKYDLDGKSLYLPISKAYFEQLLNGQRPKESRRIRATTYRKYLLREHGKLVYDPYVPHVPDCWIFDYNNGVFPFIPIDYKYLRLQVGYSKNSSNGIARIKSITFDVKRDKQGHIIYYRYSSESDMIEDPDGDHVFWYIYYEIDRFIELNLRES